MKKVKFSFAIKFTLIVLLIIIVNAGILSVVFFYNLHSISYSLAKTNVEKSIGNLRDNIISLLDKHADMLDNASYGIGSLYDHGLDNMGDLSDYFDKLIAKMPEVELLYFSSNIKWNSRGGYWIASPVWTPDEGWDQTGRPWFLNAKEAGGGIAFSEPFLDANTGGIIISISRVVYNGQGRDIGVAAADMLVTKLNAEVTGTLVYPEQQLYLLNKEGLYITNPNPGKVMTGNFFKEKNIEHYYEKVISSNTFHAQKDNFDFFSAEIPRAGWYLVSITPNSAIFAESNQILRNMILLCLIIFTIAACISIVFTYFILNRPLKEMLTFFKRLENYDLSVQVDILSSDELGDLMTAQRGFLEKIKTDFMLFNRNASMISTAVYDLSASAKEITTTANEQSASVAEIVSTMESNNNLSVQVSAKTQEVAELAGKTEKLSQRGADLHNANEDMMADIRDQNGKIVSEIRNLTDVLSRIDESVQLIDIIADKTKLIAFNAALEASSSGEAGLRFAVVAGEIRRFADNVVESVVEIKERISELQNASGTLISEADIGSRAIDSGYNRMVEQKEVFRNIVDVSQNVAVRSQQISNLSKQQELASAQIFTALKEISSGVKQFVTATASTSVTADNLNNISQELKEALVKYQTMGK